MNTSNDDDILAQAITQSLDASLDRFDGDTLAQLAAARRQALQRQQLLRRRVAGFAAAATVAAMAIGVWQGSRPDESPAPSYASENELLDLDQQMLSDMDFIADMEMIEAIGEIATAETSKTHASDS